MDKSSFMELARLCALFQKHSVNAVCYQKGTDDEVVTWLEVKLGDGDYINLRVLDVDSKLDGLLIRQPNWKTQVEYPTIIFSYLERLRQGLSNGILEFNRELVKFTIDEEVFFIVVTSAV